LKEEEKKKNSFPFFFKMSFFAETIVIGGGIAGLSAAYELSLASKPVLVLEKTDHFGGNICSRPVAGLDNQMVDYGGLEVWDWYQNWVDLAQRLGIMDQLSPITQKFMVRTDLASQSYETTPLTRQALKDPTQAPALFQKLFQIAFQTNVNDLMIYHPQDRQSSTQNAAEFLTGTSLQSYIETMFVAYTYGSTSEMALCTMLPVLSKSGQEFSLAGHTQLLIDKLVEAIVRQGGRVRRSVSALNVNQKQKYVDVIDTSTSCHRRQRIYYTNIILAAPLGSVPIDNTPLFKQVDWVNAAGEAPQFRYTRFISVCIRVDSMPTATSASGSDAGLQNNASWTAAFEPKRYDTADAKIPYQIMSYVNLESTRQMEGALMLYVSCGDSVPKDQVNTSPSVAQVQSWISALPLFASNQTQVVDVLGVQSFQTCMPVVSSEVHELLQCRQGKHGVWYAGAYMGVYSSMEIACYSGRSVACRLIGEEKSAQFEAWNLAADRAQAEQFQANLKLVCAAGGAAATAAAAVGVGSLACVGKQLKFW